MPIAALTEPVNAIRRVLFAACRRVTACRVDVSVESKDKGQQVRASYRLELDPTSTARYVLLDNSWSSTGYIATTDTGGVSDLSDRLGERIICVDLTTVSTVPASIKVDIVVPWETAPFFEASTALPRVLQPREELVSSVRRHFFLDAATHARFASTGLQLDVGGWDPVRRPQLELVLLNDVRSTHNVLFAGETSAVDESDLNTVAKAIERNHRFMAEAFGVAAADRIGVYTYAPSTRVSLTPCSLFVTGATVVMKDGSHRSHLGIGGNAPWVTGLLLSRTAGIWWGGGVYLAGFLGGIEHAIGQAVALYALEAQGEKATFEAIRGVTERRTAKPLTIESDRATRGFKLSAELALALYAGLRSGDSVWEELRAMTREYWGCNVSPDEVLRRLAEVGVAPPNGLYGLTRGESRWA